QGEFERSAALYEESLALRRELGDKQGIASALTNLAVAEIRHGPSRERAAARLEESLALSRELGNREGEARALAALADAALVDGDFRRAAALIGEGLGVARAVGSKPLLADCLRQLAVLAAAQGLLEWAARGFAAAAALRESIGVRLPRVNREADERA